MSVQYDEEQIATILEIPDEDEGSRVVEVAPNIPTPTVTERVDAVRERVRKLPERLVRPRGAKPGTSAKKPTRTHPRVSVEPFIEGAWRFAARMIQPVAWPVANVLHMQAPVAGALLEDTVKNTAVDRMLQPVARASKGAELAFALLGPPLCVAAITMKQDPVLTAALTPVLRQSLKTWIDVAGPKLEAIAEQEAKFQAQYGHKIDEMIELFLTPPAGMMVDDDSGTDQ